MFGGVGAHVSLATLAPCSVALKVGTRNWHIVPHLLKYLCVLMTHNNLRTNPNQF